MPDTTGQTGRLEPITDANWDEFRRSPAAVLVLGQRACGHCTAWTAELTEFLEGDREWTHVRFGKLLLDGPDVGGFIRENEDWLRQIPGIPFNALYRDGQPVTTLPGGGIPRLISRLQARMADR